MTDTLTLPPPTDDLLRVSEVAGILRLHVSSVYRLVDSGRLNAHALGDGKVRRRGIRIWRSSVDALLQESRLGNEAAA
jgi:excisionase family DNA binding protein